MVVERVGKTFFSLIKLVPHFWWQNFWLTPNGQSFSFSSHPELVRSVASHLLISAWEWARNPPIFLLHKNCVSILGGVKCCAKCVQILFVCTKSRCWINDSHKRPFMRTHSGRLRIRWTTFIVIVAPFWRTEFSKERMNSLSKSWNCFSQFYRVDVVPSNGVSNMESFKLRQKINESFVVIFHSFIFSSTYM